MSAEEAPAAAPSLGELLRAAGQDSARAGAALRSAILRGLLCAAALALVAVALFANAAGSLALTGALFGGLLGVVAGAVAWFEGWLARASASRRAHALGAALAGVAVAVGALAALAQAVYVVELREHGQVAAALEEAEKLLAKLARDPLEAAALFGAFGAVFAVVTFTRVRRLGLGWQLLASLAGWLATAPCVAATLEDNDRRTSLALTFACALGLPLLARAADAIERRVWRVPA